MTFYTAQQVFVESNRWRHEDPQDEEFIYLISFIPPLFFRFFLSYLLSCVCVSDEDDTDGNIPTWAAWGAL